jgi:hypothetical protein
MVEPGAPAPPDGAVRGVAVGRVVTALVSQTAILSALLFYFGWVSTNALYGFFGVDTSVLGLSVTDYLIRGTRLAFPTLLALGAFALFAAYAHRLILTATPERAGRLETIVRIARGAGMLLVLAGLTVVALTHGEVGVAQLGSFAPICAGFTLLTYSAFLASREGRGVWLSTAVALALLSLFGTLGAYAEIVGRQAATQVSVSLRHGSQVFVYSERSLGLTGPGVVTTIEPSTDLYRYRYSGLHLLIRSGGLYLLIPVGWRPGHGIVIALPDDSGQGLRIEFSPGEAIT